MSCQLKPICVSTANPIEATLGDAQRTPQSVDHPGPSPARCSELRQLPRLRWHTILSWAEQYIKKSIFLLVKVICGSSERRFRRT